MNKNKRAAALRCNITLHSRFVNKTHLRLHKNVPCHLNTFTRSLIHSLPLSPFYAVSD